MFELLFLSKPPLVCHFPDTRPVDQGDEKELDFCDSQYFTCLGYLG